MRDARSPVRVPVGVCVAAVLVLSALWAHDRVAPQKLALLEARLGGPARVGDFLFLAALALLLSPVLLLGGRARRGEDARALLGDILASTPDAVLTVAQD